MGLSPFLSHPHLILKVKTEDHVYLEGPFRGYVRRNQ
jgi:hypothetical protein